MHSASAGKDMLEEYEAKRRRFKKFLAKQARQIE
jgi:hypothetical protein